MVERIHERFEKIRRARELEGLRGAKDTVGVGYGDGWSRNIGRVLG